MKGKGASYFFSVLQLSGFRGIKTRSYLGKLLEEVFSKKSLNFDLGVVLGDLS
jgi:hypothetical protein